MVAAGAHHTGAVAEDGTIFLWGACLLSNRDVVLQIGGIVSETCVACWLGRGTHGRLGNGDNNNIFAPMPVQDQIVHRVISGQKFMVVRHCSRPVALSVCASALLYAFHFFALHQGRINNISLGKDHTAVCVANIKKFQQIHKKKKKRRKPPGTAVATGV